MNDINKNLIFAIICSVMIMVGWDYFYDRPQREALEASKKITKTNIKNIPTMKEFY